MELTENPEVLWELADGSIVSVNGLEMTFKHFDSFFTEERQGYVYTIDCSKPRNFDLFEEDDIYIYVRQSDGKKHAAMNIDELIERLKTGNFKIH